MPTNYGLQLQVDYYGYRATLIVLRVAYALRIPIRVVWPVAARLCWVRMDFGKYVRWCTLAAFLTPGDL